MRFCISVLYRQKQTRYEYVCLYVYEYAHAYKCIYVYLHVSTVCSHLLLVDDTGIYGYQNACTLLICVGVRVLGCFLLLAWLACWLVGLSVGWIFCVLISLLPVVP